MSKRVILLVGVLVLGLYVIPQATAKYAGSHTWELNDSDGVYGLRCTRCHYYILQEMDATNLSWDGVVVAHKSASEDEFYVGADSPINISPRLKLPTLGASMVNVCLMCHIAESDSLAISGSHTKIVIRVCTDLDCHGDQSGVTAGLYPESSMNITGRINQSADAHKNFYRPLSQENSTYLNEDGGFYDQGFVTCLGCHTHVGLDLALQRPQTLSLNMSYNSSLEWVLNSVSINFTNTSWSLSTKTPGTVWEQ